MIVTHPDPERIGDVVKVYEDGEVKGVISSPRLGVVRIPGLTVAECLKYEDPQLGTTRTPAEIIEHHGRGWVAHRLYKVRIADLPAAVKSELNTKKDVTATKSTIFKCLRNKETGKDEEAAVIVGGP